MTLLTFGGSEGVPSTPYIRPLASQSRGFKPPGSRRLKAPDPEA
jgi:hypothetical protein